MLNKFMKTYAVITTIQAPTRAVLSLGSHLKKHGVPLVVVGDRKGPMEYDDWTEFLPIDSQYHLPFKLAGMLPEMHYARKNLGYLQAFRDGAQCIYETDDDNAPEDWWNMQTSSNFNAAILSADHWLNVYSLYTQLNIWPRGLALDSIRNSGTIAGRQEVFAPIRQGLANGSPDVDAIWRLTMDSDVIFAKRGPVALAERVWCPFNSQNTWWSKEAFPLMYLPSFVSFRMTDIWRSFVAQRCLWEMGGKLVFNDADVFQERNPHNLIRDFADEVDGYLHNHRITEALGSASLSKMPSGTCDNLIKCYETLVGIGIIQKEEMQLVHAWVDDCQSAIRQMP